MLLLLLLTSAFVLLPGTGAGRIIGGQEVESHSRPYMAYLEIKNGSRTSYCGGFLIRPDAVLSAAHCVKYEGTVRINVILGAHNISGRERSQQRIRVRHWVKHPGYSRDDYKNDIMLLRLQPQARINEDVQFISLPGSKERVRAGDKCKVPGWGWTSVRGDETKVLREVELKVQKDITCQRQKDWDYQRRSMICVGDDNRKKAVYKGDSGGPLVCKKKAHGIVSYGPDSCLFPEVFTRISYFEPWIRKELRKFALQELPGSPSSG